MFATDEEKGPRCQMATNCKQAQMILSIVTRQLHGSPDHKLGTLVDFADLKTHIIREQKEGDFMNNSRTYP